MKVSRKKLKDSGEYKKFSNCCIEFYLNKGMTMEEAQESLKNRQSTNTIKSYIKKYGKDIGTEKFLKRNKKWSDDMENRYHSGEYSRNPDNNGNGTYCKFTSIVEKKFCSLIIEKLKKLNIDENKIYTSLTKNKQYCIFKDGKRYFYDFVYIDGDKRKIIEFNGDFWHMNPNIYSESDYNKLMCKTSKEIWDDDQKKYDIAKNYQHFEIMVVWELDWNKNNNKILNDCIDFLIN